MAIQRDNLDGETNAVLRMDHVQRTQSGAYSATVRNRFGICYSPPGILKVTPLAIWGKASPAVANFPSNLPTILRVAAGPEHCLALTAEGTVIGWGESEPDYGQEKFPPG
jgi:alpha-tubulin suppressor-like RCC1 family protein